MIVRVEFEDVLEIPGAGGEDESVSLDLFISTAQSTVKQILLISQVIEGSDDVPTEVIPLQTKLLIRVSHFYEKSNLEVEFKVRLVMILRRFLILGNILDCDKSKFRFQILLFADSNARDSSVAAAASHS